MISVHTTLLVGLILLLFGSFGILSAGLPEGVNLMKDKFYRFYWVEHPTGMLVSHRPDHPWKGGGKKTNHGSFKI